MLKVTEKILIEDKTKREWQKDGRQGTFYSIFVKDPNGIVEEYYVSERIYNKAEKGKKYTITLISGYRNKIEINDIGD